MITFILLIMYKTGMIKRSCSGEYYCDPEVVGIRRICFSYIPIVGKETDDIKTYCGNWHRITLIWWQVSYLTYKKKVKKRTRFP